MREPDAAPPVSKLVEQATSKADLSYSYWAAKSGEYTSAPDPKLLSQDEAVQQAHHVQRHVQETGASAWNMGGTFEERGVSMDWIKETLGEALTTASLAVGSSAVQVAAVASCSGEAHQWLVRGRKRAGFELEIELELALAEGEAPEGTLRLTQVSSDDLDEMQLSFKPLDGASLVASEVHAVFHPFLLEQLERLVQLIKDR